MILLIVGLVGGFVLGVLVGRRNAKTVNTVISDVTKLPSTVTSTISKVTEPAKTVAPVATIVSAVAPSTGSK